MRSARFLDSGTDAQPGDEFIVYRDPWHTPTVAGHKSVGYLAGTNSGQNNPTNVGPWGQRENARVAQAVYDKVGYGSPAAPKPEYREVRWYLRVGPAWYRSLHQFALETVNLDCLFNDNCATKLVSTGRVVSNLGDADLCRQMWMSAQELILTRLQWGKPVYAIINLPQPWWALDETLKTYPSGAAAARLNARKAAAVGAAAICLEDMDQRKPGTIDYLCIPEIIDECVKLGLDVWFKCGSSLPRHAQLLQLAGDRGVNVVGKV